MTLISIQQIIDRPLTYQEPATATGAPDTVQIPALAESIGPGPSVPSVVPYQGPFEAVEEVVKGPNAVLLTRPYRVKQSTRSWAHDLMLLLDCRGGLANRDDAVCLGGLCEKHVGKKGNRARKRSAVRGEG